MKILITFFVFFNLNGAMANSESVIETEVLSVTATSNMRYSGARLKTRRLLDQIIYSYRDNCEYEGGEFVLFGQKKYKRVRGSGRRITMKASIRVACK